ncbi:DUF2987 domain-containing protein [Tuwongella immobilis]|uniref:Uncharacterized protein n=1 Tax=Tuwongella immobilis TaxID=692036 RepID=A0A6C2YY04_9BACT|nr:DUF2987 domain-containing protein [Tuwongella immobilis]VIP05672.1 unnamed protein product [Tuwongella immobilis]VTS08700.1 unnamed protein product [Tuwongella immobilis]
MSTPRDSRARSNAPDGTDWSDVTDDSVPAEKPDDPPPPPAPVWKQALAIGGAIVGAILGKLLGVMLLLPAIVGGVLGGLAYACLSGPRKRMALPFGIFIGDALWMLGAVIYLQSQPQANNPIVSMQLMATQYEGMLLVLAAIPMLIFPHLGVVAGVVGFQSVWLLANTYGFIQLIHLVGTPDVNLPLGALTHMVLRFSGIVSLVMVYLRNRDEEPGFVRLDDADAMSRDPQDVAATADDPWTETPMQRSWEMEYLLIGGVIGVGVGVTMLLTLKGLLPS